MSKYASLLFGPEEYHAIGPFRFPVYHDLVPGESKGIEAIMRKQSRTTFAMVKLAQRVAKDKGISTKDAVDLLSQSDELNQELLYDYAAEIDELQRSTVSDTETKVSYVTLFMRYRAEVKLPKARDWQKLEDWEEEDTEKMPSKLLQSIYEFVLWERDGWPETAPSGKSSTEDEDLAREPSLSKS